MKKLLILTFILSLAVMASAVDPRGAWIELSAAPDNILNYVNSAYTENDADFTLSVVNSAQPATTISTTTHLGLFISVFAMDIVGGEAWAYCDQQIWPANWAEGSTLTFTLIYLPTGDSITYNLTVEAGGGDMFQAVFMGLDPWNVRDILVPPILDQTLTIASDPTGQPIWVNGGDTGFVTPHDFLNPVEADVYTINNPAYTWAPLNYPVPADFTTQTVTFIGTPVVIPDTYTLTVTSTPTGMEIFKGGVTTGFNTEHVFGPTETEADLFGVYTLAAAAEYFHWEPAQWDVQDIYTPRKANGLRSVADTRELYNLTIDFQQVANQYEVTFNVTPATATINGATVYTFNGTAAELFAMTFDIEAPGYVSVMDYVITPADLAAGTVTIVLEYVPTYTVNMTTVPAGYITPATLGPVTDPADIYGTYTPTDVSTTGFWTPASLTIDADTDWVADGANWKFEQVFTWTEVDYYNYYLTLNVDDTVLGGTKAVWTINGYEVTAGTPFPLQSLNNTVPENPLDVDYTIEAAPDGYEWLPMVTQNAEFNLQTKGVFGYSGSLTWLLAPMANSYRVIVQVFDGINYLPGYNFTGPVSGTTPYTSPGTADYTTLLGNYTVTSAAPSGWLWVATVYTDLDDIADFAQDPNNPSLWTAYVTFFLQEDPGITPVELSSFTATLTGQFYVQLSWTSQTETQMMGYRVYRNTSAEQSTSELIDNPMIPATNTSSTQNYTVVDDDVLIDQTYYYWLEAVDYNSSSFHGPVSVTVTGNVPPVLPKDTTMRNAYPNPFKANGSTNIEVSLKAGDTGTLTIYNVQGQLVKTVSLTEGNHMVNWNGRDSRGNACGSGIYFYKLSTQSMNQTKKMVIVK